MPTGELEVPQLTLHTTGPARPVQHESVYGDVVRGAGGSSLLRQAYVDRWGTFTPAEIVASVQALRHRVESGRWDSVAPQMLQASASALGLGDAAFVHYTPPALSGDNGSFDPARNGRDVELTATSHLAAGSRPTGCPREPSRDVPRCAERGRPVQEATLRTEPGVRMPSPASISDCSRALPSAWATV